MRITQFEFVIDPCACLLPFVTYHDFTADSSGNKMIHDNVYFANKSEFM